MIRMHFSTDQTESLIVLFLYNLLDLFTADGLHQTPSQTNSHESTSDGNSDNGGNSSGDEDSQLRLRLKRKLQRNRTSFTNEQIDSLEKGTPQNPMDSLFQHSDQFVNGNVYFEIFFLFFLQNLNAHIIPTYLPEKDWQKKLVCQRLEYR